MIFVFTNICRYVLPVKWQLRTEHAPEVCYFCLNQKNVFGYSWKTRKGIKYTSVESVYGAVRRSDQAQFSAGEMREMQQDDEINVDMNDDFDMEYDVESETVAEAQASAVDSSSTFTPERLTRQLAGEVILFTQQDLIILANELGLTIRQKEHLGSRLMDHNVVDKMFRNTATRGRALTEKIDELFRTDPTSKITYCWNIKELFIVLMHRHNADDWRLFIDGSSESLKAALVHNGNKLPTIPVAYGRGVKETYASMQAIIMLTQYNEHKWQICGDLKVVAILMGLKQGYCKHQCFLCLWEGRKDALHYDYTHKWPIRPEVDISEWHSQVQKPLIEDRTKILLPPLHIKLGLVRNLSIKLPRDGEAYKCLHGFFRSHGVSDAKIGAGKTISVFNIFLHPVNFSIHFLYLYFFRYFYWASD